MDKDKIVTAPGAGSLDVLAAEIRKAGGADPDNGGGGSIAGSAGPATAEHKPITAKALKSLVTLPASIAHAFTGNDIWIISPEEEAALSEQAAEALNVFLQLDPKKFIGISFMVTIAAVYGTRTLAYMQEKKNEPAKGEPQA